MTPDQQRKILECAAKACGIEGRYNSITKEVVLADGEGEARRWWNPLTNSADTASMCAKLTIDTIWSDRSVICADDSREREQEVRHDGTDAGKEAAWRLAASIVAAKIGGYKHED